jgi:ATPase complex subunit ATP10
MITFRYFRVLSPQNWKKNHEMLFSWSRRRTIRSLVTDNHHPNDPNDMDSLHANSNPMFQHRHHGILVHPDSISNLILPGNQVYRKKSDGTIKKRYTEWVYGYFWMLKDLNRSAEKPIVTNRQLIDESMAKVFPPLHGLTSLEKVSSVINVPSYLVRKNRSHDPHAHCTLVAISFRDFGYQQLDSWLQPFRNEFQNKDRVEILQIQINEGFVNKWFLRGLIRLLATRNTPKEYHHSTFLYFENRKQNDLEHFCDALRMHNTLPGYVFLLDGLARVRFAACGTATEEEIQWLIQFAKELTPLIQQQPFAPSTRRLSPYGKSYSHNRNRNKTRAR